MLWLLRKEIQAVCRPLLENFPNAAVREKVESVKKVRTPLTKELVVVSLFCVSTMEDGRSLLKGYFSMKLVRRNVRLELAQFLEVKGLEYHVFVAL